MHWLAWRTKGIGLRRVKKVRESRSRTTRFSVGPFVRLSAGKSPPKMPSDEDERKFEFKSQNDPVLDSGVVANLASNVA